MCRIVGKATTHVGNASTMTGHDCVHWYEGEEDIACGSGQVGSDREDGSLERGGVGFVGVGGNGVYESSS